MIFSEEKESVAVINQMRYAYHMITALLLIFSISLSIVGQFLLKSGVLATPPIPTLSSIFQTLFSWRIIAGLSMYGFSVVSWLFILKRLPLSVAYPTLSLSYVAILAISVLFLGESFTFTKLAGIMCILFGVTLLYR